MRDLKNKIDQKAIQSKKGKQQVAHKNNNPPLDNPY